MSFFVEWSEFDVECNAWLMLGHGFGDPAQARNNDVTLTPTAEVWSLEGTGCSTLFVPKPRPCTISHFAHHADGWKMIVTGGELLDVEPLPINDMHAAVKADRPIRAHAEMLLKAGVLHHGITVRGDVRRELHQLAERMKYRCDRYIVPLQRRFRHGSGVGPSSASLSDLGVVAVKIANSWGGRLHG